MTRLITVGYDGSTDADHALQWAADEASARNVPLRIVSCFDLAPIGVAAGLPMSIGGALEDAAGEVAEQGRAAVAASHPLLHVEVDVLPGSAALALTTDGAADGIVVVGASGHRGIARFWLGSTARTVVRAGVCPVVVTRGVGGSSPPRRIVVGVDSSRGAHAALLWAADEANLHGVDLAVAHGWIYPYDGAGVTLAQGRDVTRIDAACVVDTAVETARERCLGTVTELLVEGDPVDALLDTVRSGDLLVVGSRGRGAIVAGLFGSTVNGLLEQSTVPIAVIPTT